MDVDCMIPRPLDEILRDDPIAFESLAQDVSVLVAEVMGPRARVDEIEGTRP